MNFPTYLEMIQEMADNYKNCGSFMSAAALLEDCEMYEESMQCKAIAGN